MKKNLMIALATGVAATAAAVYFIMKRKRKLANTNTQEEQTVYHEKSHHLTNAFSKAKKHAMHLN